MTTPTQRLSNLGIHLPAAPAPAANYVPTRVIPIGDGRSLIYVAGQIPRRPDGQLYTGRVSSQVGVEEAQQAARACAIAILAQLEAAAGLERIEQVAQVQGWVLSDDDFDQQPAVINGCSDLLVEVLGEAGRHSRAALGTNSLPLGVTVEIAAVAVAR
ncbi:MAG TPA: RidA family protein [Candidatus Dormibacteraeota bacterium]